MTDRELLENAAKAAGLTIKQSPFYPRDLVVVHDDGSQHYWDPLKDDGDAFRLMVELGMNVFKSGIKVYAMDEEADSEMCEGREKDPYAATRRAITRTAADIGEAMK
jgi:hypothetical protein